MKFEELEKELKQEKIGSLYLFYGEEQFLLENSLKKIKSSFGEMIKGINYILIDEKNVDEIIQDLETPAFGYPKKLIIARNTHLFKKDLKKKSKSDNSELKEKLNEYINNNIEIIKETAILIFIEENVEKCNLLTTIEKLGIVCNFEFLKPAEIQKRLKAIATVYKVDIDNFTLSYLIECAGTNMQELINEIRKLIEYAGPGGKITKEDVDALVIKKMEAVIFDLTDSLGKKNTKNAIEVLRNLMLAKEPPQKILITLYNHFKKLYLVKFAIKNNMDIVTSLNLKPNQVFLANKYKQQAGFFKEIELRQIINKLCDLDYNYKIGLIDLNIGFESILCAYI